MSSQQRQKAKDLIEIALGEAEGGDKERITAALKACQLIKKYELLDSPLDGILAIDNETVQAASTILSALTDPMLVNSVKRVAKGFGGRKKKR